MKQKKSRQECKTRLYKKALINKHECCVANKYLENRDLGTCRCEGIYWSGRLVSGGELKRVSLPAVI